MELKQVKYSELNSKQKEIYNFQKLAGILADYGFNCIKLHDDWEGADFLAYHKDRILTKKVQLKGRVLHINKKYKGKGIDMAFCIKGTWYLVPHDVLLKAVGEATSWLETDSWNKDGGYGSTHPSKALMKKVECYALKPIESSMVCNTDTLGAPLSGVSEA